MATCPPIKLDYLSVYQVPLTPPAQKTLFMRPGASDLSFSWRRQPKPQRGKRCPACGRHQPRHLESCLPWHARLAQVGLSREHPEAWPADTPGGQTGGQDSSSAGPGGGVHGAASSLNHTPGPCAVTHSHHQLSGLSATLKEEITWARLGRRNCGSENFRKLPKRPPRSGEAGGGEGSPRTLEPWPNVPGHLLTPQVWGPHPQQ